LKYPRRLRGPLREPSSTEWRKGGRTSSQIPCQSPWRRAGAAVGPRRKSASTRCSWQQSRSGHIQRERYRATSARSTRRAPLKRMTNRRGRNQRVHLNPATLVTPTIRYPVTNLRTRGRRLTKRAMKDFLRDELGAPKVVDRSTFQAELDALRVRDKTHIWQGDAIAAARRRLPMVEGDGATSLIGEHGAVTLLDVFHRGCSRRGGDQRVHRNPVTLVTPTVRYPGAKLAHDQQRAIGSDGVALQPEGPGARPIRRLQRP
jgi:hypothetical protein